MPDEPHHAAEAGSEPRSSDSADAAPILDRSSAKSPLITAVEIAAPGGISSGVSESEHPASSRTTHESAGRNSSGRLGKRTRRAVTETASAWRY